MLGIICHLQCDRQEMSVCNGKVTVAVINPVYIEIKTKYQQRTSGTLHNVQASQRFRKRWP